LTWRGISARPYTAAAAAAAPTADKVKRNEIFIGAALLVVIIAAVAGSNKDNDKLGDVDVGGSEYQTPRHQSTSLWIIIYWVMCRPMTWHA
jgi:hypothetical protein